MSTTEYDELHYRLQELDRQITELHRTGYRVDELIAKRDGMKRALDAMRPAQRPPTATKRKPAGSQRPHVQRPCANWRTISGLIARVFGTSRSLSK